MINRINFKKNWNNKLNNDISTTIRKHVPHKYIEGNDYHIYVNDKYMGLYHLKKLTTTIFIKIPQLIVMLDTGYNYFDSCEIFRKFFGCTIHNLDNQLVDVLILEKVKVQALKVKQAQLF